MMSSPVENKQCMEGDIDGTATPLPPGTPTITAAFNRNTNTTTFVFRLPSTNPNEPGRTFVVEQQEPHVAHDTLSDLHPCTLRDE